MYQRVNECKTTPKEIIDEITTEVKKKLSITGNIWYISHSLSALKGVIMDITDKIGSELNIFRSQFAHKVIYKDFAAIYQFSIKDIFKFKFSNLGEKVKEYILNLRSIFYPPGELIGSPLGLPLNLFD